jgi:hypothetical protein
VGHEPTNTNTPENERRGNRSIGGHWSSSLRRCRVDRSPTVCRVATRSDADRHHPSVCFVVIQSMLHLLLPITPSPTLSSYSFANPLTTVTSDRTVCCVTYFVASIELLQQLRIVLCLIADKINRYIICGHYDGNCPTC